MPKVFLYEFTSVGPFKGKTTGQLNVWTPGVRRRGPYREWTGQGVRCLGELDPKTGRLKPKV